jgi:transposase InsO family protein
MRKERKHFTPEEKVAILRRHLVERWHKSLKGECIRPGTPLSLEDARRLVEGYVEHYNNVRLNSAIGYITPKDMLAGHQQEIQAERDRKLDAANEQRKNRRHGAA